MDPLNLKDERKEAEERLKEDFSEKNFLNLLTVLLLMGDMRSVGRYLRVWRERRGEYPPSFKPYLALYYMRSMEITALKGMLPDLPPAIRSLVHLKVFADPLKALELAEKVEDDFIRARVKYEIGTFMGRPYPLPEPRNSLEELSLKALRAMRGFHSGRLLETLKVADEMVDEGVDSWLRPTALHVKENELLLRGKASELHFLRLAAHDLGMRREAERIKIYERFLGEDVEIELHEEDRSLLKVLELSQKAREGMHLPEEKSPLFGLEAFWWYVSNVRKNRTYLSFSGRLRLMEGLQEIKLPRRRALVLLAFIRLKGYTFARENAHVIFPESARPKRRAAEYLRYIRPYLRVPIDVRIAKRFKTFLDEEGEGWAGFLREHAL